MIEELHLSTNTIHRHGKLPSLASRVGAGRGNFFKAWCDSFLEGGACLRPSWLLDRSRGLPIVHSLACLVLCALSQFLLSSSRSILAQDCSSHADPVP